MQHAADPVPMSADTLAVLPPATLERQAADLIRRYVRQGSASLAAAVVRHLEALCGHPELRIDAEGLCGYRQLLRHWRWLATRDRMAGA